MEQCHKGQLEEFIRLIKTRGTMKAMHYEDKPAGSVNLVVISFTLKAIVLLLLRFWNPSSSS